MENPLELAVIGVDVVVELGQRKRDVADDRGETAGIDIGHGSIVGRSVDWFPFHDVARLEQAHEVAQIADLLIGIVDWHRRDPEHLVATGAAYRVDAAEASAVPDGEFWRIRA